MDEKTRIAPAPRQAAADKTAPAEKGTDTLPFDVRRELIAACRRELELDHDDARGARLYFEIARVSVEASEKLTNYQSALLLNPHHLPSIRGAREQLLERGDVAGAADLFEAEIRIAHEPSAKARLLLQKGRLLEDIAQDVTGARDCYFRATELDPNTPTYFKALQRVQLRAQAWTALSDARDGAANAVQTDNRHRAALIVERARLVETRLDDSRAATELYERALELDSNAAGALEALKRLLHAQGRWRDLVAVLEREANQTNDSAIRTQALFRMGRTLTERLGSREEAKAALARAMQSSPSDRLVLESLARLYEEAGEHQNLAHVLAHMAETVANARERLGLLHRIGSIYERDLRDDERAQRWYDAALQIDAAYAPAVNALDNLYERSESWESLIVMHLAASETTSETSRRANANARIADIFERRTNRPDEAIRHHNQALALDGSLETSFKALVRLYSEHGRHRELIDLYARGIDRTSEVDLVFAYLFKIGAVYEDALDEPKQAMHIYERVLQRDPDHLGALHALQRAAERAERYVELVGALTHEADLTNDKERKVALLHRAAQVQADHVGDADAAVITYRKVLQLDDTYAPAVTSLGKLYHALGRYQDQLETYQRELQLIPAGPSQVSLLHKLGELCQHQLADDTRATGFYRRALEQDPRHQPSLRALALQLERRRDYEGLAGALQNQLLGEEKPDVRAGTAYRLGAVYEVHLSQHAAAVSAYQQSLAAEPTYRPAIDGLSRVRGHMRDWAEQAEELMTDAGRVKDQRLAIDALLRAGEVYCELLGDQSRAIAAYEAVRAVDCDCLAALLALEPLYRQAGDWANLAEVYLAQAKVVADPGAKIAAYEELAHLLRTRVVGSPDDLRRAYGSILSIDGTHHGALEGLEQIALQSGDLSLLADVDSRAAKARNEPTLLAMHETRLGEALERSSPTSALAAYRMALEHDAEAIGAIRGMARAAESSGDAKALVEACRREAAWTRHGAHAAEALVRGARIRLEKLGDATGAIADAEAALERWPDHEHAARMLSELLREAREIDRLINLLRQAAGAAQEPARVASLWRVVARLHADDKGDLEGALAALEHVKRFNVEDAATFKLRGDLYSRNKQWAEAVDAYNHALMLGPAHEQQLAIRLELARLYAKKLGDKSMAVASLNAALQLDETHRDALLFLHKLQQGTNDNDGARLTAQRLLKIAADTKERAWALVELGRVELRAGRRREAAAALHQAVAIEGATGEAATEYKRLLGDDEPWDRYVDALNEHLQRVQRGELRNDELREEFTALARIQHEVLLKVEDAVGTLRAGLEACDNDQNLHLELADRLSQTGRVDDAMLEYRRIITADPGCVRSWRGLARTYHDNGHKLEAGVALAPLVVMGEATDVEAGMSRQRRTLPGWAKPGSLNGDVLARISAGKPWEEARIQPLMAALSEGLGKVYATDFDSYRISSRDKLRSDHPVRVICDRVAQATGVAEFDVYLHASHVTDVVVELSNPPAVMVPKRVSELPVEQQAFMLARAFVLLARGMHFVVTLGRREMNRVVAGALRTVAPAFGAGTFSEDELNRVSKRVHKALSRRNRKLLESAATLYLSDNPVNFEQWGQTVELTSARAAALLANDLPGVISVLRQTGAVPARAEGAALANSAPIIADLLRFWPSELAYELRRDAGIL